VNRQIIEEDISKSLAACGCSRICWLTACEVEQLYVSKEINRLPSEEYHVRLIKLNSILG